MTTFEPGTIQPSNEAVATAGRELIELVAAHLPQRFYPSEHPWRMFGAAVIVRMAGLEATQHVAKLAVRAHP